MLAYLIGTSPLFRAVNVKKLTCLKLSLWTSWWHQSTKTAKIFWVTLDGAIRGAFLLF